MKIKITTENAGKRLDVFLAETLAEQSRSQLQKIIKQGLVKINEKIVTPHYNLKEDDEVEVLSTTKQEKTKEIAKKVKVQMPKIEIVKETEDYLVINKVAGLIVHGDKHITEATLADVLVKKFPEIKKIGDDPFRPGIVHRLDKDVSGLMVVARTQKFFEHIKKQFQNRTTDKKYTALVFGKIVKDELTIDFPIERSVSGHKMASRPNNQGGRTAISKVNVLQRFINYTLVRVQIITGRTHQVRTHLAAYGNPIVGDNIYATKTTKEKNKKLNTGRVYLVADELSFKDLQGERQSFKIELPEEFKELLGKIK